MRGSVPDAWAPVAVLEQPETTIVNPGHASAYATMPDT
jgi:hypothetical protein